MAGSTPLLASVIVDRSTGPVEIGCPIVPLGRIEIELLPIRAKFARGFDQLDAGGLEQREDVFQRGIVDSARVEPRDKRCKPARKRAVRIGQLLFARRGGFEQRRRVRKSRLRLRERRPFVVGNGKR